ncbi:neutral/alkaline non-lysosomal ceramidase N-terminal domain-containing protein [candidate division KSB1 bacterium]
MNIGFNKTEISPENNVELAGYGFYLNRISTGIKDPLFAKSIILSSSKTTIVLVSIDLIGICKSTTDIIREKINRITKIPKENILISAVHTHSGPSTVPLRGVGGYNREYIDFMTEKIIYSVETAYKNMFEGKIGFGKVEAAGICCDRTQKYKPISSHIDFLKIVDNKKKLQGIAFFIGCHSVVLKDKNHLITPDYSFYTCKILEKEMNIPCAAFFQGSCGNVNPITKNNDFAEAEAVGEKLSSFIIGGIDNVIVSEIVDIRVLNKQIKLPTDNKTMQELQEIRSELILTNKPKYIDEIYPEALRVEYEWIEAMITKVKKGDVLDFIETEFQYIKINEIIIVGIPGEIFNHYEKEIKRVSGNENIIFIGYANDFLGYFPDENDFKVKGYASNSVPVFIDKFHFKMQIIDIITKNIFTAVRELNNV